MAIYVPPLTDIRFLLHEVAGLAAVAALPGCSEATPDVADAVLEEAGRFCAEVLAPLDPVGDRAGCAFADGAVTTPPGWRDAYGRCSDSGWVGLELPTAYGGQGLPKLLATPVWEMIHAANLAFSLCPQLAIGETGALLRAASPALKDAYLPGIVSGEFACAMDLTEPQAGSDLAAIRTRAEPHADGSYRLFGSKIFITYGEHDMAANIVHLVLARLPDAPPGVKGISMFLVPKVLPDGTRNDVACTGIEHKLGIHGSPTCAMSFGERGGATGWLVGEANRGLEYMFVMMNEARFAVGVQGFAVGDRAYQKALAYARERVQGRPPGAAAGAPIVHHPDVQRTLLGMRARLMAARSLAYTAAAWFDVAHHAADDGARGRAQRFIDLLMPVVKAWSTELGQRVCYDAIQVHGGMGFVEETGVARHYRDIRITTIYEGTTGIQANDLVGRKILREDGATLREFMADLALSADEFDREALPALGARLRADLAELDSALRALLAAGASDPPAALAAAVPFLHLLGGTCATWQMGRIAQAAQRPAARAAFGDAYAQGLVDLARFHADCIAPEASAHAAAVRGAGATRAAAAALVA
ncbi:MAG: acyl-CoA dehydrogenase family protein [Burkholderiales bacterium]